MSELISGQLVGEEVLIALANGDCVEYTNSCLLSWHDLAASGISINEIIDPKFNKFRLKPRTITIGNIEVPAPFKPKDGDNVFVLANFIQQGYLECKYPTFEGHVFQFGAWRNENEIKQVIAALRSVFEIK